MSGGSQIMHLCAQLFGIQMRWSAFFPGELYRCIVRGRAEVRRKHLYEQTDRHRLIIGCGSAFAKEASCRADKLGTKKIILVGTPVTRLLYPDFKETAEILRSQGFCVELSDTSGYETVEA